MAEEPNGPSPDPGAATVGEAWRPFSVRQAGTEEAAAFDVPHVGAPPWLQASLMAWVRPRIRAEAAALGVVNRLHLTLEGRNTSSFLEVRCSRDPKVLLDVVDALINEPHRNDAAARELDGILKDGGSALTVGKGANGFELQERVDPTVTAAAKAAASTNDRSGQHLARAWSAAYRRNGDPGAAYGEAVKAVEAAACPVVIPKDQACTLGKVIPALRDGAKRFEVGLDPGQAPVDQVGVVVGMLELLWKGQNRHGSDDESTPIDVSPQEAAAAVHLAVVLVQWFRAGVVRRKST